MTSKNDHSLSEEFLSSWLSNNQEEIDIADELIDRLKDPKYASERETANPEYFLEIKALANRYECLRHDHKKLSKEQVSTLQELSNVEKKSRTWKRQALTAGWMIVATMLLQPIIAHFISTTPEIAISVECPVAEKPQDQRPLYINL